MLTTLDGKIIGDYLEEERTQYFIDEYEKIHERYGCKAYKPLGSKLYCPNFLSEVTINST
ncbi:hypothetical protein CON84_12865 [Bacillus sp. AFS094228]|nr:hypothetical protein CON84_12865 [Bacillus sp. AFS094228]